VQEFFVSQIKIAIAGAAGKMGAANIKAVSQVPGLVVHSAFDRAGSPALGKDAGEVAGIGPLGVAIVDDVATALEGADAIIDFTVPAASVALAQLAAERGIVHIIGTTGCTEADYAAIAASAKAGAKIVKTGNFSLGVNLLVGLVRKAAAELPGWDVEIVEMHHNRKVDAPSGTALMLGQAAAEGRGIDLSEHSVRSRDGHTGPREAGTIGFASLRGGNVVGDHTVILAGNAERIELTHKADNRALFADGAARAAQWAATQPPGLYTMADVLGFTS
jgi:4-hydroxy-tetrahydrodipicolinate reductase